MKPATARRLLVTHPMAYWDDVGFGHVYFINCIRAVLDLTPIAQGKTGPRAKHKPHPIAILINSGV